MKNGTLLGGYEAAGASWSWSDNSVWNFTIWRHNRPNNDTTEDCVYFLFLTEYDPYYMVDASCDLEFQYICKISLQASQGKTSFKVKPLSKVFNRKSLLIANAF